MRVGSNRPRTGVFFALTAGATLALTAACGGSTGATSNPTTSNAGTSASASKPSTAGSAAGSISLTIGGGASGGNYYLLGSELGKLIESDISGASVSVAAGDPGTFIRQNKDIIFTQPDQAECAWKGEVCQGIAPGEKYPGMRLLAIGYLNSYLMMVNASSSLKSVSDITSAMPIGITSGSLVDVDKDLFAYSGHPNPDLKTVGNTDTMMTALRAGSIEVAQAGAAHPIPSVVEASQSMSIKLLPYDKAALDKLVDKYPYAITTIPANTYSFQKKPYTTWGRTAIITINASVPDDVVYQITKLIYEHIDDFKQVVPAAADFNLKNLQEQLDANTIRFPIANGALKYFEENGIKIPSTVPKA